MKIAASVPTLMAACLSILLAPGCGQETVAQDDNLGELGAPLSSSFQQNWSGWPNGQCIAAAQIFFENGSGGLRGHKGFLGLMPNHYTGGCKPVGACHTWLDNTPDGNFNRHAMSDGVRPFDVIVYLQATGSGYGHIAAVDHVDSAGNIFVMDSNWCNGNCEQRASAPHTIPSGMRALGFYRLKALEPTSGGGGGGGTSGGSCVSGGFYCGGDKVHGDGNTLYQCNGPGTPTNLGACADGCQVVSGQDDECRGSGGCQVGGYYCGGDKVAGNPSILYRCTGGSSGTPYQHCANGCAILSGRDDACR